MEENESEAPRLSPPLKKTKFRGSILKKTLVIEPDSSMDSIAISNEKPERKSRRVSFAAQTQIRVFEKEDKQNMSIGESVVSLRKKGRRKKTGELKAKATALTSNDLTQDDDRANMPKHRFSIASNRDAEIVSMDSFSHNVKSTVDQINKKPVEEITNDYITHTFKTICNSPVRRSPRLNRITREAPHQKPSAEVCALLLQPYDTNIIADETSIMCDETTMHVDISCFLNKLDSSNVNATLSNENLQNTSPQINLINTPPKTNKNNTPPQINLCNKSPQRNISDLMELSPIITKSEALTYPIEPLNKEKTTIKEVKPPTTKVTNDIDDMRDWSMNLSNNNNTSLQTHNLISLNNSTNEELTTADANISNVRDPLDLPFDVSSICNPQRNEPIFYQVDSSESSSIDIVPTSTNRQSNCNDDNYQSINNENYNDFYNKNYKSHNDKDDSLLLTHKLISILDGDDDDDEDDEDADKTQRENADAVYETFLNKSNWFLDKISEINMDYTAKLIHSGSFNESKNNTDILLLEDRHQITDHNIVDMDISMGDTSCTRGIEQLATDARNTFVALNSLLHPNRTANRSLDSFSLEDSAANDYSLARYSEKYRHMSPPAKFMSSASNSQSTNSLTFVMPAVLGDDLFEKIMETIKTLRKNLEHSNFRLSENFNTNQSKLIQPLHARNNLAENDNKELASEINALFTSLSHQKKKMSQLQFDEKFLRSSLNKVIMETEILTSELNRKLLIENIETNLFYTTLNIQNEPFITTNNSSSADHILNLFNVIKLQFQYENKLSVIVVKDILIAPFLNTHAENLKFLLRLLQCYRNNITTYFKTTCSMALFSKKIKNLSLKLYQNYALFDALYKYHCRKYPMQFNFCDQLQNDMTVSFKLYSGNFVYSDITLRFCLNNSLECVIDSYNVVDLFQMFDCAGNFIKPLKKILDDTLLKPLFPNVDNLFSLMDKICADFHQQVSSIYSQLNADIGGSSNNK